MSTYIYIYYKYVYVCIYIYIIDIHICIHTCPHIYIYSPLQYITVLRAYPQYSRYILIVNPHHASPGYPHYISITYPQYIP